MKFTKAVFTRKALFCVLALSVLVSACGQTPASSAGNTAQNISNTVTSLENQVNNLQNNSTTASDAAAESLLQQDAANPDDTPVANTPSPVPASPTPKPSSTPVSALPSVKKITLTMKGEPELIKKHFESSALCFDDSNNLYTVSDKGYYTIFRLEKSTDTYQAIDAVNMNNDQIKKLRLTKQNRYDFEGLTFYNNLFYVADERDRKILTVDRQGNINDLNIDINGYMNSHGIRNDVANSGLEGLAIDRKKNIMYLMKERQESAILVVDLNANKVIRHFKVNLPGPVEPALSDANFFEGYLYVLVRSHRLILKLNPDTGEILSEYDYRKYEEDPKYVYWKIPSFGSGVDPDGYGVMEGLAITKDNIYLVTDNNELPLKRNIFINYPQLFTFARPE